MTKISVGKTAVLAATGLLAVASFAMAQDAPPQSTGTQDTTVPAAPSGGWRRVGDAPVPADSTNPQISQSSPNAQTAAQSTYPQPPQASQQLPMQQTWPQSGPQPMPPQQQRPYPMQAQPQASYQVPALVTVPAGSYVTVRVNQRLSSDKSQVGDAFSATLVQPIVANGVVVAEPGQTLGGRVSQVQKSGHVSGLGKLGVELTDLALVDGQQMPIKTMFVSRTANSTTGRDAGAIFGTTALGAAAGAVADLGRGAAIGAGAGLVVGTIGVLVTRGEPAVVYPEQVLTFKLEEPLSISTERSPQAFRYVQPNEYSNQMAYNPNPGPAYGAPAPYAPYAVAPGPYAYGYPYYGYPYYYPYVGFGFYGGGRFYGRGFYGGGYGRGGFRR